jgi:hypothetical protein
MVRLRNLILASAVGFVVSTSMVSASVSASEATMNQIVELAKTIDGASAATMYLATMGEIFDKMKAYVARYDFSSLLNAQEKEAAERELGKYLNDVFSVIELNSSAQLKASVCQFVFDNDLCMALKNALAMSVKNLTMTMFGGNHLPDTQSIVAAFKTYCDSYLAAAKVILTERFNLDVPHCVGLQDYGLPWAVVAK